MKNSEFNNVVLVDENDNVTGVMEKLEAHQKGLLHRAFSIIIFNNNNQMLLQQRAMDKYHSGGLWTNACCSHPSAELELIQSAKMRLKEEMGMSCELTPLFSFIYKVSLENDLIEHELDHVLVGKTDALPELNLAEAMDYKYVDLDFLLKDLKLNPQSYTFWFQKIMNEHFTPILQFINK